MFVSLKEETASLGTGVHQLDGAMGDLARQAMQVSDSSTANAASIDEITAAVSQIADHADEADKLIRETGDLSQAGARDVSAIASDSEKSVGEVGMLAQVITHLDKAENSAIQGARETLSRLSGNARNTQQLLDRFHVQGGRFAVADGDSRGPVMHAGAGGGRRTAPG